MAKPDDAALLHPLRALIARAVEAEPGLSLAGLVPRLRDLTGNAKLARNPIAWHLQVLIRSGFVVSARSHLHRRFYPAHGPWTSDLDGFAFVQLPNRLLLSRLLVLHPGLTVDEVRARLPRSMTAVQVRYLLRGLAGYAMVTQRRAAGRWLYEPTGRLRRIVAALAPSTPSSTPPPPGPQQPDGLPRPGSFPPTPGAAHLIPIEPLGAVVP